MDQVAVVPMKDIGDYITPSDCLRLENVAYTNSLRDGLIISLMWREGLRASEVCDLKKKYFIIDPNDPENSIITVYGKGKKWGRVPINVDLLDRVKEYISGIEFDDDFLFASQSKYGRLTRIRIYQIVKKYADQAGVFKTVSGREIHPHSLRHSFAIMLVTLGVPIPKVQQLLRHSSLSATTFYLQFSKVDLAKDFHEAFRKLSQI